MVKPGYKQTEVGVIPEDWYVTPLNDVAEFINGVAHEKNVDPCGRYILVNSKFISTNGIVKKYTNIRFQPCYKNDVLLVMSDVPNGRALARTYFVSKDDYFTLNQRICALKAKKIDPKLLFYILNRNKYYLSFNDGAKQTNLSKLNVLNCPLVLSSRRNEQEKIAEALSDTDNLISSLEKLIEKKKAIKQGAMQNLLTGKTRLPGFTGKWRHYIIGEMGKFYSGLSGKSKKDFDCGKAQYITFLNVLSNVKIDTKILASVDIQENESQNAVKKGDLFFNTSSETPEEVGMCAVLDEDLDNTYLNSFCFGFRLNDGIHNPLFLSYYLNSEIGRKIMNVLAQGATRYNLSKNKFAETVINLPTKEEQTAIASILSDMDNEIEQLEQKLTKTRLIKQGMMQQLLTGKIRLV